ncbi:MAG: 3-oxoacyl-[acyl-carrier-protein] synthase III C-terminal domain-containing protein [Maricaulaceae bacterium]|jgi:3-oxoacyl-[acyl-carrier-protein] synthase-3
MNEVYLTGAGAFLPGAPVGNDEMAARLGAIDENSARIGRLILRQNKIGSRHYAIDADGEVTHSSAEMAARAVADAVANSESALGEIDFLATSTTQGDLLVPGHASAVHAELAALSRAVRVLEVASFQSVCASAMMAARAAWLNVRAGEAKAAAVVGSEFSLRWFQPGFYRHAAHKLEDNEARMSAEFLRWTLSDGAGAILLEPRPNERRASFKVEWVSLHSLAHRFDVCMYAGAAPDKRNELKTSWSHYAGGPVEAAGDGAVMLLQDMALLKRIIRAWVGEYLQLVDQGRIVPDDVDWLLCHYSAHSLREEIISILKSTGGMIDEEKWFTNLPEKGNTGSASLFVMLDEFVEKKLARPGDRILCVVPESGRAIVAFMMLTAL